MFSWQRSEPKPPVNVRLILDGSTELPVDCVYRGRKRGIHRWEAIVALEYRHRVTGMMVDQLPEKTSVGVAFTRRLPRPE